MKLLSRAPAFALIVLVFLTVTAGAATTTPPATIGTIEINPGTDVFGRAVQNLKPGDTLIVHPGTYYETARMSIQVQGTATAPITVTGAPGEALPLITRPATASLQNTINIEGSAKYLTLRGLEITGNGTDAIDMVGSLSYITLENLVIHDIDVGIGMHSSMDHITIRHNHIYNTGIDNGTGEGMYIGCNNATCSVHDSVIENNWVHDALPGTTQGDGIEVKVGSYGNIIRDNVVYNRPYPGIFVYGTGNNPVNVVERNVIWNADEGIYAVADAIVRNNIVFNSGTGLSLYSHVQVSQMKNITAVNNTLYGNSEGVYMRWSSSATNMILANNAIYSPSNTALNTSGSVGTFVSNFVTGNSDRSLDGVAFINGGLATSAFVNPSNSDFWPKSGSPLIGKANDSYAPGVDFNNTARVSPNDVGAYERNGLTSNPGWKITPAFKDSNPSPPPPADTTPPTVSITAPASGSTVSGSSITVFATASDNVGVVGVQFKLDGTNLGAEKTSAPFSVSWNTTSVTNGNHTLTAVARDAAGNQTTSASVSVTVNNTIPDTTPPAVSITGPSNGSTISATTILSAIASDNVRVAGVQFKLDGANLGAEVTSPPYSMTWNTTTATNGSHTLTAVARDTAGNQATSSPVSFTVSNLAPDTTAPAVSVTNPADGSMVLATIGVSAIASDNVGVVGVQFKLDGANLGAEITVAPYSTSWNTTTVSDGIHTLTAVARDATGNQTTSVAVSITVGNNTAPTVSIMTPTFNSTVSSTVPVTAAASDSVGIAGVQFQVDGANWGTEVTSPPYTMSWNTSKVSNGSHILTALARDNAGKRKISSRVAVNVSNPIRKRFSNQLTRTFTISGSGGASFFTGTGSTLTDNSSVTSTSDPLQIGYAGVQMDTTPSSPSGFAILSGRVGGVLVGEASVPAASTMSSGRVYANINGSLNTGIAFANPNDEDAVISFYFTDASGNNFGQGSFTLGANLQISRFLSQAPFNVNGPMEGTFTFNSSVPVGVTAIQGFTNQRNEFLISILPVASLGELNNNAVLLPHFTDGAGWTTQVVLTNPSDDSINGTVQFFGPGSINQDATPLTLSVNGVMSSTFNYGIASRSVVRLVTGNTGDSVQTGSVRITPSSGTAPVAVEIFSFRNRGITVSQASILAAATGSTFRMYAETSGPVTQPLSIQSGVAISNPGQTPATVNIVLTQMDGSIVGQPTTVTLPPSGQTARFVKELFPSSPNNFNGFIAVTASSPIGVVGLRMRYNERGDFLIAPTPPRNDSETLMDSEIMFPHVVSSGAGYSSQFVIFGQAGSGGIYFNSADGAPMPTGSLQPVQ